MWLKVAERQAIIDGYGEMFRQKLEQGWSGYLLTFTFKQIGRKPDELIRQMKSEVERVYGKMLTRIIKDDRLYKNSSRLPFWIVCPDFPVPKSKGEKNTLSQTTVNSGLHMHALVAVPPWSKLKTDLVQHVTDKQRHYATPEGKLQNLHAAPIIETPERASRYVLKSVERGLVAEGEIFTLPRSRSELVQHQAGNPKQEMAPEPMFSTKHNPIPRLGKQEQVVRLARR